MGAAAVAPDLNFIPSALVKRIDVLTGGASSVYGADAVSGVVNFILDKDFEGAKVGVLGSGFEHKNTNKEAERINAARGFTAPSGQAWDGSGFDAYAAFGGRFGDGRGHATVYLDHPYFTALDHTLNIDLVDESAGPAARVAVELSPDSARALIACIETALARAEM